MAKKKSYNPFRMKTPWIFGIICAISSIFIAGISCMFSFGSSCPNVALMGFVGFISGFLIGWGIHSLVRYLKK